MLNVGWPSVSAPGVGTPTTPQTSPAEPLNGLVAALNPGWRVVDDRLQWILERRTGAPSEKSTGWKARSFCRTREGLLRCVREYCGEADISQLLALPEWHPDTDDAPADKDAAQQRIWSVPVR
jgi:hypothetical protein